jgi:hypothetical protein
MDEESSMERAARLTGRAGRWGVRLWTAVLVVPVVVFVVVVIVVLVAW